MKNLYYKINIENELDCNDEACEETTCFQLNETDLTMSELKAFDLDDLDERAEQTHCNFGWEKINGDWYCERHAELSRRPE